MANKTLNILNVLKNYTLFHILWKSDRAVLIISYQDTKPEEHKQTRAISKVS